jgi:hypothetical protein
MITARLNSIGSLTVRMQDAWPPAITVSVGSVANVAFNLGIPGPRGPAGPPGDVTASSIGMLADVELSNLQDGDAIVYNAAKFRNLPIENITDGGNF